METIYGHNAIPHNILQGAAGFRQDEVYHVTCVKVTEWVKKKQERLRDTCSKLIFPWADEQLRLVREAQKGADRKLAQEYAGRIGFLEFLIRRRECLFVWLAEFRASVSSDPDPTMRDCAKDLFDQERAGKWAVKSLLVTHTLKFNAHATAIANLFLAEECAVPKDVITILNKQLRSLMVHRGDRFDLVQRQITTLHNRLKCVESISSKLTDCQTMLAALLTHFGCANPTFDRVLLFLQHIPTSFMVAQPSPPNQAT